MDTEYDRYALKAIIFCPRSRQEVEALAIKADEAAHFLKNSCQAIEDKGTAHGRRHDSVLYTNKHVKKKDFPSIATYHLYRKGKKLIKSGTTVLNTGRPRNKSSQAAKAHLGKWLFSSKKPPNVK